VPKLAKSLLPPLENLDSIGLRIRNLRLKRGLTQAELGKIIGITQYHVSRYEMGVIDFSVDMLCRFALALSVNPDYLLNFHKIKIASKHKHLASSVAEKSPSYSKDS
jgi:transcriptional regulator with XRE-family HTH domain